MHRPAGRLLGTLLLERSNVVAVPLRSRGPRKIVVIRWSQRPAETVYGRAARLHTIVVQLGVDEERVGARVSRRQTSDRSKDVVDHQAIIADARKHVT